MVLITVSILATACSTEPPPPPLSPAQQAAAALDRQPAIPQDIADGTFSSPLSPSDAERILLATGVFDLAESGFRPGRQVEAFNVLLDQPDAQNRFRRLASQGRAAGRLYALCGLLLVARGEGITFAYSFSLHEGAVTVREGDFWFDTPIVRAIVLVFANELPNRLLDRRDEAYAYFKGAG